MQKGSLVSPERLRFDFSHNKPIENDEMSKINEIVNNFITGSSNVQTRIMTPKEAVGLGALALFGEKYGDEVRVVFMGKENNGFFSTELCGGTHVKNTKEIEDFKVISQSSIASGIRRVEALRNGQLRNFEKSLDNEKMNKDKNLSYLIEITKNDLNKLNLEPNYDEKHSLEENLKNLNKQLDQAKVKNIIQNKNKIIDDKFDSLIFRKQVLTDLPPKELRNVVDQGKKEIKSGIIMACCTYEEKVGVAIGVTEKLVEKYDAVELVKKAAEILGGKGGGGRKDFAQAGGANKDKIAEAFEALSKKIN
jgi:alanyl-tRNA synthetase